MVLPDFFIPGIGKAGTFTLYNYLMNHPQVLMSRNKEPNFFSKDKNYERGLEFYSSTQFAKYNNERVLGEASVAYSVLPEVAPRIKQALPDAKFIFLLRDPIERLLSQYVYWVSTGYKGTFRDTIDEMVKEPEKSWFFRFSEYARQLNYFMELFPRENILILISENLRKDFYGEIRRVCQFLNIDYLELQINNNVNYTYTFKSNLRKRKLDTVVRLARVEKMLGQNLTNRLKEVSYKFFLKRAKKPEMSEQQKIAFLELIKEDLDLLKTIIGEIPASWQTSKLLKLIQ